MSVRLSAMLYALVACSFLGCGPGTIGSGEPSYLLDANSEPGPSTPAEASVASPATELPIEADEATDPGEPEPAVEASVPVNSSASEISAGTPPEEPSPADPPPAESAPVQTSTPPSDVPVEDPSGEPQEPSPAQPDPPSADEVSPGLLSTYCGSCHGPGGSVLGLNYINDTQQLLNQGMLVAGDPDASPIIARIKDGSMPPVGSPQRPSAEEVLHLESWVAGLAVTESPACERISLQESFEIIQDDLRDVNRRDRQFFRYLTLTHLDNAGVCGAALEIHRAAMNKIVNSVSLENELHLPSPVDAAGLIYRVDLRDFGWDRSIQLGNLTSADVWEAVIGSSPFAVEFEGGLADDIKEETETTVFALSLDAFIQMVAQPPLYYELLQIPDRFEDFSDGLNLLDVAELSAGDVFRAGFKNSEVSQQDRIIERSPLPGLEDGFIYRSYDYAPEVVEETIFSDPVNLDADGGEFIYTLPNGLHGYLIIDEAGQRLDSAPTAVVADPRRKDFAVRAGISCMSCHVAGIIPKTDQVRAFVEARPGDYSANLFQRALEMYAPSAQFSAQQQRDAEAYLAKLSEIDVGGFSDDPVSANFYRFEADVGLRQAAAELMVEPETLEHALPGLDTDFQVISLTPLDRELFTSLYLEVLCSVYPAGEVRPSRCD